MALSHPQRPHPPMHALDLARWPRRESFEHFRRLEDPYFNVCTRLDLTALLAIRQRLPGTLSLAYHHLLLRAANEIEPFRYRFDGGRPGQHSGVMVHDVVHGSTTVLRADESIAFAPLHWREGFAEFVAASLPGIRAAQRGERPFDADADEQAVVHFTTLPWFDFTSFSHARNRTGGDAVPKVAFGRIVRSGGRASMALGLEVHHAMMDGVHVGHLVQRVQGWLDDPASVLLG